MRFLADENFPLDAVEALRQNGHDVAWIRNDSPGIADPQVLERAQAEDRIVLTFDKDFGELAFREKLPATTGIILFRIKAPSSAVIAEKVARSIAFRDDWYGHFSVVEDDKIRMRELDQTDLI
jgi:predicted nuclease of predicted toxin-antitoxin system